MQDHRGTLAASNITKSYGAETILDGASLLVLPRASDRSGRAQRQRKDDAPAPARRVGRARRGRARAPSADADRRPSRPGGRRTARRDAPYIPRTAHGRGCRRDRAGRAGGAPRRRAPGRAGARRRPRALPLARRRRLPRTRRRGCGPGRARPARPAARETLGRRGRACQAGRDPALALRRAAPRRADERPRFRRPRAVGALRDLDAERARPRLSRPGVSRADGRAGRGVRGRDEADPRVRRGLVRVRAAPRGRPARRRGSIRTLRR